VSVRKRKEKRRHLIFVRVDDELVKNDFTFRNDRHRFFPPIFVFFGDEQKLRRLVLYYRRLCRLVETQVVDSQNFRRQQISDDSERRHAVLGRQFNVDSVGVDDATLQRRTVINVVYFKVGVDRDASDFVVSDDFLGQHRSGWVNDLDAENYVKNSGSEFTKSGHSKVCWCFISKVIVTTF
jgi:hypothetical protein